MPGLSRNGEVLGLRNRGRFQFGNDCFEMMKRLFDGEGIHLFANALPGFESGLQKMAGNLDSQRISYHFAGAFLVFHPGRKRKRDPDGPSVHDKFVVHRVGVPGRDGHDLRLVDAVHLRLGPAINRFEIVEHYTETIAKRSLWGQTNHHAFNMTVVGMGTRKPINILQYDNLKRIPWLLHGFSTRGGGFSRAYGGNALNLGFTAHDSRPDVEQNRKAFLTELGALNANRRLWPLITLRQIHSDIIHRVDSQPQQHLVGDGLVTETPGILLAVQTADCLPVILVDKKQRSVGAFHAGWRGTVKRIVQKGVGEMHRWFGTLPQDIRAAIGPGIHNCCYEVGEEVREKFHSQFSYGDELFREIKESDPVRDKYPLLFLTARPPGHSHLPRKILLDLVEANRRQLLEAGVPAKNISASELCTSCRPDLLFSYRAEKGPTGRLMGVAGIRGG